MQALVSKIFKIPVRYRRLKFILRIKFLALLMGVETDLDIDKSLNVGKNCRVMLTKGGKVSIKIGYGCVMEDGFHLQIFGGVGQDPTLIVGDHVVFHRNVSITLSGTLRMQGPNEWGIGTVFRVSQGVECGSHCGSGEYVSIFDFTHAIDEKLENVFQKTLICQPVKLGDHVVLSCHSTINPGVVLSQLTLVFPHTSVSGQWLEPGTMISGVPGRKLNKPEIIPLFENPFAAGMITWQGNEPNAGPGPNFKTAEQALKDIPDPTRYNHTEHGWSRFEKEIAEKFAARSS